MKRSEATDGQAPFYFEAFTCSKGFIRSLSLSKQSVSMSEDYLLIIQADGGCNPNPGRMYGSYQVRHQQQVIKEEREVDFGPGTNNVAEFRALQSGIIAAWNYVQENDLRPADWRIRIYTDSTIVRNRLQLHRKKPPTKNEAQQRLNRWSAACLELLIRFGSFQIDWLPRHHNVATFGH